MGLQRSYGHGFSQCKLQDTKCDVNFTIYTILQNIQTKEET